MLVLSNPVDKLFENPIDYGSNPIDRVIDAISSLYYSIYTVFILKIAFENHVRIMLAWFGFVYGMTYFVIYSHFFKISWIGTFLFSPYSASLLRAIGYYIHFEREDQPVAKSENPLNRLRKQMYNRTKFLNCNHKSEEEDPIMINSKMRLTS